MRISYLIKKLSKAAPPTIGNALTFIHPGLNLLIYEGLNTTTTKVVTEKPIKHAAQAASAKPAAQAPKEIEPKVEAASTSNTSSRKITVKATAYTASCEGCSGTTATGINL